jgi:hypothetical protein
MLLLKCKRDTLKLNMSILFNVYSISVYLYLQVSMFTTGEGHMICSVNLIGQLGKLKGPF